jgi:hypothetical protein
MPRTESIYARATMLPRPDARAFSNDSARRARIVTSAQESNATTLYCRGESLSFSAIRTRSASDAACILCITFPR